MAVPAELDTPTCNDSETSTRGRVTVPRCPWPTRNGPLPRGAGSNAMSTSPFSNLPGACVRILALLALFAAVVLTASCDRSAHSGPDFVVRDSAV